MHKATPYWFWFKPNWFVKIRILNRITIEKNTYPKFKIWVFCYYSPHYSREFKALVSGVSSPLSTLVITLFLCFAFNFYCIYAYVYALPFYCFHTQSASFVSQWRKVRGESPIASPRHAPFKTKMRLGSWKFGGDLHI